MQLFFGTGGKISNNIAEYVGLVCGLKAAITLGVQRIIVKGDSQLIVNFSTKTYKTKDPHMDAYFTEVQKLQKRFLGVGLEYIPRLDNKEFDEIAKRASEKEAQRPGVFEERLTSPSATPPITEDKEQDEQPPPAPPEGAPDCGLPSGDRLLLAVTYEASSWITELKDYLQKGTLPPTTPTLNG